MGDTSFTVCVFCLFFFLCTVPDFSAVEKDRGVKLCMLVRLLSGQVFSRFVERWLTWSNGGDITSEMSYIRSRCRAVGIGDSGVA